MKNYISKSIAALLLAFLCLGAAASSWSADVDTYKFRGFQEYTPELPADPSAPLYDLIFFWPGVTDPVTGLVRCDPYGGKDYTGGDWPRIYNYNPTYSCLPSDFAGADDTIDLSIPGWGLIFDNISLTVGDGFSIGFKANIDSDPEQNTFAGIRMGFLGTLGAELALNVGTNYVGKIFAHFNDAIYSTAYWSQGTDLYCQLSYWPATNIAKIYVDGVEVLSQEVSPITTLSGFQILAFFHSLSGYTVSKLIRGVALSTDPDLMMYTTEYNGVKLNDLTEYPKLLIPTINTHPTSQTVISGDVNFTGVVSNNGDTATIQWYVNDGGGWDEIVGETSFPLTVDSSGKNGYQYRFTATNSAGTATSNAATLTITPEIDYMEYASNGAAQAAYFNTTYDSTNALTTMTSNSEPSGEVASASSEYSGSWLCYKTFNNIKDGGLLWISSAVDPPHWLQRQVATGFAPGAYAITVRNDYWVPGSDTNYPTAWTFQGSNNGTDWTTLDTQTGQTFTQGQTRTFAIPSPTATTYTYFRLYMTAISDGVYVVLNELEIIELKAAMAFSEASIKEQGSYALKVAATTDDLNATVAKTFSTPLNLTDIDWLSFAIRSSRTGENIKLGLHDSGGTTTEVTPDITDADEFQTVYWDLSAVANANKDAIDKIIITIVNADSANTFYVDDFKVDVEPVVGEILFGTHFDDETDWNSSSGTPSEWDSATMTNIGTFNVGDISATGKHGTTGKGFTQRWAYREEAGTAQDCWLNKGSISYPDEFWIGYWFKIDPDFSMPSGNPVSLKIMKLQFDDSTTWDIYWTNFCAGCEDYNVPSGCGGYSICTDEYGKNWFGSYLDVDDGDWHYFVWHIKHSTDTVELFVDGADAHKTAYTPSLPGTGLSDTYGVHFGGNISGNGIAVDGAYTMFDDVCIGTTREIVEQYLGI